MSEHTPLPWKAMFVPGKGDKFSTYEIIQESGDGTVIATVRYLDLPLETDAEFIVHCVNSHDDLLAALEGLRDDLQNRLNMATDGATVADGLVHGEDANRSWRSWLFDVMSTHGDIARTAIDKAKLPA